MEDQDEEKDHAGWELKASDGSCLHVGVDEQCVEKAVETVSRLTDHLATWKTEKKKLNSAISKDNGGRVSRLKTLSASSPSSRDSVVSFYTPETDNLLVQGLKTGQLRDSRKKFDWSNAEDVVVHIMTLIKRLEKDREVTVRKWREEREKVIKMRKMLDEKAAERLRLLPLLVQQGMLCTCVKIMGGILL